MQSVCGRTVKRSALRQRTRRKSCSCSKFVTAVICVVLMSYTFFKGILADLKFHRWLPRLLRELRRDQRPWSRYLRESKSKPLFQPRGQVSVIVITLDRAKERSQRLKRQLRAQAIQFVSFSAVDGALPFQTKYFRNFAGTKRQDVLKISKPTQLRDVRRVLSTRLEFACFLTHMMLWEKLLSGITDFSIIMEDDVNIKSRFMASTMDALLVLPFDWDVLYLGSTNPRFGGNLHPGVYQLRGALGTFGYVISRAGAAKMIEYARGSDKPIDHLLDSAIYSGKVAAFQVIPALLVHRDDLKSTLAHEQRD